MADLEALKQKYAGVIQALQKFAPYGATLDAVDLDGEKLHIKGTVPSRVILERVWDSIKKADPTYSDLHHEIANTGGDTQASPSNPAIPSPPSACSSMPTRTNIPRLPKPTTSPIRTKYPSAPPSSFPSSPRSLSKLLA